MNGQKLLTLASQLVLAGVTNNESEIEKISEELAATLRQTSEENRNDADAPPFLEKDLTGFLKFNDKEISKMPKAFRHTFFAEGQIICYRKRKRGKVSSSYEARYRRHGYNISVSAKNVVDLKQRFIEQLNLQDNSKNSAKVPTTFHEFSMYYFENFRKRKVKELTYETDMRHYKRYLQPIFGSVPIKQINAIQCQELIDGYINKGHGRTAEEVYSLLSVILKMAIAHGIIYRNPLDLVIKEKHQRKHGKALTKDEEKELLKYFAETKYQVLFAVALYTGLRPNEYYTARIEGDFIIAVNSKRKNHKVEYKRIPITPMLRPYLNGVSELDFPNIEVFRDRMKEILPDHKIYDLRTTFYTRCQECGIAEVARMEFVGHSLGALGDTYTDLSDDFLLSEGKKFKY